MQVKHLNNILDGIASAFMWGAEPRPYVFSRKGFRHDAATLRRDAGRVGQDMKRVLQRHGKQVGQGTR
jgi:hypothetical protein